MPDTEQDKFRKQLKRKLEPWREIFVAIYGILLWEKSWYPAVIVGATSTVALMIWLFDPTFISMVSLVLFILAIFDYALPFLVSSYVSPEGWDRQKEIKFDDFTTFYAGILAMFMSYYKSMCALRCRRPNIYYGLVTVSLLLIAWLGSVVNNLLLTYLIVTVSLIIPGIKAKGGPSWFMKQIYHIVIREQTKRD